MKEDIIEEVKKIANNALYFDDDSDFATALWEILEKVAPELFEESDMPKLKYIEEGRTWSIHGRTLILKETIATIKEWIKQ